MKRPAAIPALLAALGVLAMLIPPAANAQQGGYPNDCTYSDAITGHCVQVVVADLTATQRATAFDAVYAGTHRALCSGRGPVVTCQLGARIAPADEVLVDGGRACVAVRDSAGVLVRADCGPTATPAPVVAPVSLVSPVVGAPVPVFTG